MSNQILTLLRQRARDAVRACKQAVAKSWPEWALVLAFLTLVVAAIALPYLSSRFAASAYSPVLNALLSIGAGGLASLLFYYVITARLEARHRKLVRDGLKANYASAKRNIAYAIVFASQKGGRKDLQADTETIDRILTIGGFRALFEGGQQADEGYYAFENQMSDRTPEFDEIVFNLKTIGRALDRIVDNQRLDDLTTYKYFVWASNLIARIERNGPGYDESKPLCAFIWEMFAGWNFVDGQLGYDPIERAISRI